MLEDLFFILQEFSSDKFSLASNFTKKSGYLYLPLHYNGLHLIAKQDIGYKTISEVKNRLLTVISNLEQAQENQKQLSLLQTNIQQNIQLIKENNLHNIIFTKTFENDIQNFILVVIYNNEVVINNGMNQYTLKSSISKLKNSNTFNILFHDGEIFGLNIRNLSIIIQSKTKLDKNTLIQIEFKMYWLNSILYEQELNLSLEQKIKQVVEKTKQQEQQLLQQSRLAQMGEMISMIAHQWRQPLTAISSTSAAINIKASLDNLNTEDAIELSSKISSYTQHLSATIDDFRNFFKAKKDKKTTTYKEVILSVLNIVEVSIINKNIQIIKQLDSKKQFLTYPNELMQVVLNLIKNAEDILLEKEIQNPTIKITTQDNKLIISDNAGGVEEEIITKIFNPYFSTKKEKNGMGLGLYMSKVIVEQHCDGKLSVTNDNDGAVFTITLN